MPEETPNLSDIDTDFINRYIKKLTEHSNDFHDKLIILETKSEVFFERLQDATKEIENLKKQLEDHASTASVNSELSGKVNDMEFNIKNLQDVIGEKCAEIEKLENERNNLRHIVNQKNDETAMLSKQLEDLYNNPAADSAAPSVPNGIIKEVKITR